MIEWHAVFWYFKMCSEFYDSAKCNYINDCNTDRNKTQTSRLSRENFVSCMFLQIEEYFKCCLLLFSVEALIFLSIFGNYIEYVDNLFI